jgi:hypothetical protein
MVHVFRRHAIISLANGRFPERTVLVMQVFRGCRKGAEERSGERRFQRPQGRP